MVLGSPRQTDPKTACRLRGHRGPFDRAATIRLHSFPVLPNAVFDYGNINVRRVEHFAENRYGVHFKDTNEFGLYCFFMFDDGRTSYSYYRTDSAFENEQRLDVLRGVLEDTRQRLGQSPRDS